MELSGWRAYSNVVLGIATTLEDALTVLRFAQTTMMKRYAELEQLGLNNFLDLPEKGQALMVMVDEAGELLGASGVKALAGSTFIPTPEGGKLLEALQVGDEVLGLHGESVTVTKKYEPGAQQHYRMVMGRDRDGQKEELMAGAEHLWVAYFQRPDGAVDGPSLVETKWLHEFKTKQEAKAEHERVSVKFKRYSNQPLNDLLAS